MSPGYETLETLGKGVGPVHASIQTHEHGQASRPGISLTTRAAARLATSARRRSARARPRARPRRWAGSGPSALGWSHHRLGGWPGSVRPAFLDGQEAVKSATLGAARSSTRGGGWAPSGWASLWECRAAQSRQARPEEAQEPSWGGGTDKGSPTLLPGGGAVP